VVLDLPPPQPAQADSAPATTVANLRPVAVVQDTSRPPIEETLDPDSALALLPRDGGGYVDWVAAVRDGMVRPRRNLPGSDSEPPKNEFGFDFFLEGPNPMFDAAFPHSSHVQWLDCKGCHPSVYRYRGTQTNMAAINSGESCGLCHRSVAVPAAACFRCHPAMPPSGAVTAKLETDIVFQRDSTAGGGSFAPAVFPHWVHRIRYACTACHPQAFEMRTGAAVFTMAAMQQGQQCGACHDGSNGFSLRECGRCHVMEREESGGQ
jgi:c(7)-type cytochrome triheme protein